MKQGGTRELRQGQTGGAPAACVPSFWHEGQACRRCTVDDPCVVQFVCVCAHVRVHGTNVRRHVCRYNEALRGGVYLACTFGRRG